MIVQKGGEMAINAGGGEGNMGRGGEIVHKMGRGGKLCIKWGLFSPFFWI